MDRTTSTTGPCPSPADDLPGFMAWHRAQFGDLRMEADDTGGGGGDDAAGGDDDKGAAGDKDGEDLSEEEKAKLGDAGKQAIDRMKERARTERDRRKAVERELAQLKSAKPPVKAGEKKDDEPDADAIRQQARDEARVEAKAEVLKDRVSDKIEAKAGTRFAMKPERIAAILLRENDVEDFIDGDKVDADAIAEALDKLLEEEPHLAAQGGKRFNGTADGGTRKETPAKPTSLQDAVAAKLAGTGS